MKPWGKALEDLRGERSLRSLETAKITTVKAYKRMLTSVYGPSVAILDRILHGWGYSWQDWSRAFEAAVKQEASQAAWPYATPTAAPGADLREGSDSPKREGSQEEVAVRLPDPCEVDLQRQLLRDTSPEALKQLFEEYLLEKLDQSDPSLRDRFRAIVARRENAPHDQPKKLPGSA